MTPARGLFTALSTYSSSATVRPLENFTTELMAWLINEWPDFGRGFANLFLVETVAADRTVSAKTQMDVPDGYVDLVLQVPIEGGPERELLIESKIEAAVGIRGHREDDGQEETQIDCYLRYAQHTGATVGLISKYPIDVERWKAHSTWCRERRWHDVADVLNGISGSSPEMRFITGEVLQFLREHGMTLEPVGPHLLEGTLARHHLQLMFEEAADACCAALHLRHASARSDRYAMYVALKDSQGQEIGGPAYSDLHGDSAVWLSRATFVDPALIERLRSHEPLRELAAPGSDRWWACAFVPLVADFSTFFRLSAKEQVRTIERRLTEVLAAAISELR